jgi:uncharacterized protein (DUF302 family)
METTLRFGIIMQQSNHTVDETLHRLLDLLETRSIKVFAVVDHSGEAAKVGLQMPATKLVLFGSPAAGTPVMLAAPSAALDLPLKILVSQDSAGAVWLSYNSPAYLAARHGFSTELKKPIASVEDIAKRAAE